MTDSAPGQLTRQQLYDRIRESSKDEVIINEMKRLGFWPEDSDRPDVAEQVIKRSGELERDLNELLSKQRRMENPELALKEMHAERKAKALEKREETRLNNFEQRHQRALAWYKRNKKEIVYLGDGVSSGLSDKSTDSEKLFKFNLQPQADAKALAASIGISLSELRFLTYTRASSRVHHYKQFEVAKKTGGTRQISAPMPRLKLVQYWIKNNILNKIASHDAVHGFMAGKSIVTNAVPHVNCDIVINMDLKDFFPTITYKRVKGYFQKLGYSGEIATLLGLLCTESEVDEIELDGDLYYVSKGLRRLPQGAPTSPDISNLICYRMDKRIVGAIKDLGFTYTRYADDMTFSSKKADDNALKKLFWRIHQIIDSEGFTAHPLKTRIMRKGSRQEVTGIVVNDKVSVNRKTLRQFQACLHQTLLDGPEGKSWGKAGGKETGKQSGSGEHLISSLYGFANYVKMVDPAKGDKFLTQVREIQEKYGKQPLPQQPAGKLTFKAASLSGNLSEVIEKDTWWQPRQKPAPLRDDHHAQEKIRQKQAQRQLAKLEEFEYHDEEDSGPVEGMSEAFSSSLSNVGQRMRAREAGADSVKNGASNSVPKPRVGRIARFFGYVPVGLGFGAAVMLVSGSIPIAALMAAIIVVVGVLS